MSRSTGHVEATFYAQVEPEWGRTWAGEDEAPLRSAKVVRTTQQRPKRPQSGTVLLKLTVRVPAGAFYPLRPEAVVVIPESLTELGPIEVVAGDPHADPDDES